jgi:hypothetical protein
LEGVGERAEKEMKNGAEAKWFHDVLHVIFFH